MPRLTPRPITAWGCRALMTPSSRHALLSRGNDGRGLGDECLGTLRDIRAIAELYAELIPERLTGADGSVADCSAVARAATPYLQGRKPLGQRMPP